MKTSRITLAKAIEENRLSDFINQAEAGSRRLTDCRVSVCALLAESHCRKRIGKARQRSF